MVHGLRDAPRLQAPQPAYDGRTHAATSPPGPHGRCRGWRAGHTRTRYTDDPATTNTTKTGPSAAAETAARPDV